MSTKTQVDVTQILDGAVSAFSDAMKAGVKAQEEMVNYWTHALDGGNPLGEWTRRSRQMFEEAVPAAQKQSQEFIKLVEQNYRRSVELLKKACDGQEGGVGEGVREKLRQLWEESVTIVKENAQTMAQANVKLMEVWTDLLKNNFEKCCETATKSAAVASKAAK